MAEIYDLQAYKNSENMTILQCHCGSREFALYFNPNQVVCAHCEGEIVNVKCEEILGDSDG